MSESRADREERLAVVQEDTEQRMRSVADALPDPDRVHERADQLSDRARQHQSRAEQLRDPSSGESSQG
jgi:hypothetical protein